MASSTVSDSLKAGGWTVLRVGDLVVATRLDCFTTEDGYGSVNVPLWIDVLRALNDTKIAFRDYHFEIVQCTPSGIAARGEIGTAAIQAAFPDWGDSAWRYCGMMWVIIKRNE